MNIQNPKYLKNDKTNENIGVEATIDGTKCSVPLDTANRHYAEILKQVADGDITIAEAD
jgi:hypothetical protein